MGLEYITFSKTKKVSLFANIENRSLAKEEKAQPKTAKKTRKKKTEE